MEPISIVIPVHGKPELLREALQNILAQHPGQEILVVDDGTKGPEASEIQRVAQPARLLRLERNRGFSAAVNYGVRHATNRLVLLMNNDVRLHSGCLRSMESRIRLGASVVGARLLYPGGKIQHGGVYYAAKAGVFDHRFRFMPAGTRAAAVVDRTLVTGALMLINREIFEAVGMFDEDFFIAWEDMDLCLRVFEAGRWCCYDGQAVATHLEGATRGNTDANKVPCWHKKEQEGAALFWRKWAHYNFSQWRWR